MVKGSSAYLPVALLCTVMICSTRPALAQTETADWSGEWDSRWRDGGARLILEQDGEQVTGTYPLYDGQIKQGPRGRSRARRPLVRAVGPLGRVLLPPGSRRRDLYRPIRLRRMVDWYSRLGGAAHADRDRPVEPRGDPSHLPARQQRDRSRDDGSAQRGSRGDPSRQPRRLWHQSRGRRTLALRRRRPVDLPLVEPSDRDGRRSSDRRAQTGGNRHHVHDGLPADSRQVIDRAGYITWQEIPDDPNSRRPYVHYQHARGDIVVAPVETDGGVIWQFTPETLRDIQAVHAEVGDMPLPPELAERTTLHPHFAARNLVATNALSLLDRTADLARWQWLALVLMVVVGVALGILARRAFIGMARAFRWERLSGIRGQIIAWGLRSVTIGAVFVMTVATAVLGLQAPYPTIIAAVGWTLVVIGFVPVSWQLLGVLAESYRQRRAMTGRQVTLVSLTTGITRFAMIVAAVLLLAHVLAIPYQNVITGLGIGGLAVALAAQPMLQNFLSGLSLYADKPLAVGDFCRYGDKVGTIENIGARSTRIRSLDRTLITIPNSEFANLQLENFASRDRMWLMTTLQVRYETTPDQLRYLLTELRRLLIAHPKISPDPARVRFAGFGQYSLDLEIFTYVLTADYNEFLAVREDVFLRMMTIVKDAGTDFAFPSHVEYHAKDEGIPAAKIQEAEAKVAAWRSEGQLPFPDVDWREGHAEQHAGLSAAGLGHGARR